jgi:hypothetical protein
MFWAKNSFSATNQYTPSCYRIIDALDNKNELKLNYKIMSWRQEIKNRGVFSCSFTLISNIVPFPYKLVAHNIIATFDQKDIWLI